MKLNNKGFAITSVLYGLLILFVILVGSYLTILVAKKNRLDTVSEEINDKYGFMSEKIIGSQITNPYTAEYTGKYLFTVNDTLDCTSYIEKGTIITSTFNGDFAEKTCNDYKTSPGISSIILEKIYYNGDETNE
ncbi:MAG: hypothetical protein IJZ46_02615 [Bacilli bacterium]|nr:hypothetical protein [Bacilli bacterium]